MNLQAMEIDEIVVLVDEVGCQSTGQTTKPEIFRTNC